MKLKETLMRPAQGERIGFDAEVPQKILEGLYCLWLAKVRRVKMQGSKLHGSKRFFAEIKAIKFKTMDFDARDDNIILIEAGLASTADSAQTHKNRISSLAKYSLLSSSINFKKV